MGIFDILFNKKRDNQRMKQGEEFDIEAYNNFNNSKIQEFTNKYDLNTVEGIRSVPISEATKYKDVNQSVVYMPEQILMRKATEYKKIKNYDLAIECLKKSNELLEYSPFAYTRDNYERLVDYMILAGRFDEARVEHNRLDKKYGSKLLELKDLQNYAISTGVETKEDYQNRVINPYLEEFKDRERYYWLLENFPELAPKSFGSYRTIKKKNTANYIKVLNELNDKGIDLENISFWK